MIIIPAIDIKNGRCVRLLQGQMSKETVYSDRPEEMAVKWHNAGAERLHLVDLDGAYEGKPINIDVIKKITEAVPIPIQLGGGIRDFQTIDSYINLGIEQVILGTIAYKDPEFLEKACVRFPGKIILGIDARDGYIAIEGWTEETEITPSEIVKKYEDFGISAIIYTDIHRDGMSTGPNIEATKDLARSIDIPVIASGGISGIEDVINVSSLKDFGVTGMITGKALYDGKLNLADSIKILKEN
jgi:phosphoribosylformimino-5-aminoimidazole carboxamide ribotide isomerase